MSDKTLLKALQCEKTDQTPVWFMRQAGRYLPEYNQIRSSMTFIELTQNVKAAVEVSIQPYRRFALDGIIMFSDILTPLQAAGVSLHFEEGRGPVIETPFKNLDDLKYLENFDAQSNAGFVAEILQELRRFCDTEGRPTAIGFGGAPFTLASYMIEGGSTRSFELTKRMLFQEPENFLALANRLTEISIAYLDMQARAGAQVLQIFDSWGGVLQEEHYMKFAAPGTTRIIAALKKRHPGLPIILFVGNAAHLIRQICAQESAAISLDWRVGQNSIEGIPERIALQGNLDPLVLYGSPEHVAEETKAVLEKFKSRQGYVFNLGHGIHPRTPVENVETMIRTVRSGSAL